MFSNISYYTIQNFVANYLLRVNVSVKCTEAASMQKKFQRFFDESQCTINK